MKLSAECVKQLLQTVSGIRGRALGPQVGQYFVAADAPTSGGGDQGEQRETTALGRHRRSNAVDERETSEGLEPKAEH